MWACNPLLMFDVFNVEQRHRVNTQARVQLRITPSLMASVSNLTQQELEAAVDLIKSGCTGPRLGNILKESSPAVRGLFKAFKLTNSRVMGSPQSFLSLRSKARALWHLGGTFSLALNINPFEFNSDLVFHIAGQSYTFLGNEGLPCDRRPDVYARWRTVARNPRACAEFYRRFLAAFCNVFLGWSLGNDYQHNPNCLFGRVKAFFFKHESSGRGAIHGHGMVCCADLQPERIAHLMERPETKHLLFTMIESLMSQCLPEVDNITGGPPSQFHAACIAGAPTTTKPSDMQACTSHGLPWFCCSCAISVACCVSAFKLSRLVGA
jgi:hypothetical protein